MKIVIIENFLNTSIYFRIGKKSSKTLLQYKKYKLKSLIKELKKKNDNLDINVFFAADQKIYIDKDVKIDLISEYRIKIDRSEYIKIKEKIVKETTKNSIQFLKNSLNLKTFHYKEIFLGKLIEFYVVLFFNEILGEFEIVKKILESEKFDKIIFFNANPIFSDFYLYLTKKFGNVEIFRDKLLEWNRKISIWLKFKNVFPVTNYGIRNLFFSKKIPLNKQNKVLFIANTTNHYKSLSPIYNHFKNDRGYNPMFFKDHPRLNPLKKYPDLIKFLFQMKKIWNNNFKKISSGLIYDSLKLNNLIEEFYKTHLFFFLTSIFKNHYYFEKFIEKLKPSIAVLADSLSAEGRLYAKFCKLKNIPTIYVPHAGTPVYDELITKSDFSYSAISGEFSKNYLISKGEEEKHIIITGRARYTDLYSGKIKKLNKIQNMNNNRIYKFEPNKFIILYTTNPFGDTVSKKSMITIINALNELGLIENLVIKLHPRESGMVYKEVLKSLQVDPIIVKDLNILELINSCSLLLAGRSTTILEAMIIGKPVILLDLFNFDFSYTGKYEFCTEKSVIIVENQAQLMEKIEELAKDQNLYNSYSAQLKERAKFFSYFSENENPTEKIAKLIKDMLRMKE